jgi:effector-binding domain-containing protein
MESALTVLLSIISVSAVPLMPVYSALPHTIRMETLASYARITILIASSVVPKMSAISAWFKSTPKMESVVSALISTLIVNNVQMISAPNVISIIS